MKLSQSFEPKELCAALASTQDIFLYFKQADQLISIGYHCSQLEELLSKIIRMTLLFGHSNSLFSSLYVEFLVLLPS